ncbi:poly(A) polymerase [Chondromyces crocatus]|uniref:Polynucleotide adenylyltransferase n=1 Tax=Chondromyces crocatus TaxID=52 RepID=A0A0K1EKD4_CHOCO|nr:poly(A) polymerase [Chondromyces crocatus]AKT41324.1 polynucleotide adenylyltransferase [Chondromyces crocatus]
MRTSEEIYNRIRWDARFEPARFVLGIDMHAAAPKRIPLPAFVPGGDIPWHRIVTIEADGEVIWDRLTGVDCLGETQAGLVRTPQRLRPPFFSPRSAMRWDPAQSGWVKAETPAPTFTPEATSRLRLLTWNTLWDRYDADRIHTAQRRPLLVEALHRADADVIALQEVELPLLEMLLAAGWVRAGYTLSDGPRGRDVDTAGLLLLSRLPVLEVGWHALGPHKAVVAMTVALAGQPLIVAATHLTSDHTHDGPLRRVTELAALSAGLGAVEGDRVLLGDLNDAGRGPAATLGMKDAWLEARGAEDETPTFDPTVNPLAAVSSRSGRALRLDRVLVRGATLRSVAAALEGAAPVSPAGLFLSDHYGVTVDLSVGEEAGEVLDTAPTARTALAWVPTESLWREIQAIRTAHDPQIDRWPPHVNLLFGFAPESSFEAAMPLLSAAAGEVEPFTAVLEGARSFRHSKDATVWLDPAAAGTAPWARLHQALVRRFPRCRGRAEGYTPHLTLGRVDEPARVQAEWTARLGRREAPVGELVLLSRRGDGPMQARAWVALGSGVVRWASEAVAPSATGTARPPAAARPDGSAALVAELEAALPGGVLHVTGSRRLGCALPGGDLDLVAVLPGPVDLDATEARVRAALPDASTLRRVEAIRVPGLELCVAGLDVDLTIVDAGTTPPEEAVARRLELGEAAAMALSAVTDADAVLQAVETTQELAGPTPHTGPARRREAFLILARTVKLWARAKGLDAAPFGGLPGIAWLVLSARTVREARDLEPGRLLASFFGNWAAWDWRSPIALAPSAPAVGAPGDPVRIATPTPPLRSCSDGVSTASLANLSEELYAAWEVVEAALTEGRDPLPDLCAPPLLHRRHAAWAVITVAVTRPEGLPAAVGRMRGRMRALLSAFERAGVTDLRAWPRAFDTAPRLCRHAIGLGQRPPATDAFKKVVGPWAAGLHEVHVEFVEGGAVPTLR